MRLPNADRAIVGPAKLRDELLSSEHPVGRTTARFFAALGFRRAEWPVLRDALRAHVLGTAEPTDGRPCGQKYTVRGMLLGPAGRQAAVVSVWLVLTGKESPRLVTAYAEEAP